MGKMIVELLRRVKNSLRVEIEARNREEKRANEWLDAYNRNVARADAAEAKNAELEKGLSDARRALWFNGVPPSEDWDVAHGISTLRTANAALESENRELRARETDVARRQREAFAVAFQAMPAVAEAIRARPLVTDEPPAAGKGGIDTPWGGIEAEPRGMPPSDRTKDPSAILVNALAGGSHGERATGPCELEFDEGRCNAPGEREYLRRKHDGRVEATYRCIKHRGATNHCWESVPRPVHGVKQPIKCAAEGIMRDAAQRTKVMREAEVAGEPRLFQATDGRFIEDSWFEMKRPPRRVRMGVEMTREELDKERKRVDVILAKSGLAWVERLITAAQAVVDARSRVPYGDPAARSLAEALDAMSAAVAELRKVRS